MNARKPTRRWVAILLRRVLPALAVLVLLGISLQLADDAAAGGSRLLPWYPWILATAAVALLLIALAIIGRLVRLRRELARGAPGAQLTRRLLFMLVLLAVPPVVVVYGFSLRFLNVTVDTWFNVKLEKALDDALEVGRIMIDQRLQNAEQEMEALAQRLTARNEDVMQAELDDSIDAFGAIQLTVFGDSGRTLASASSDPRYLQPPIPDAETLMRVQGSGRYAAANRWVTSLRCASCCRWPAMRAVMRACYRGCFRCRRGYSRSAAVSRMRTSTFSA